MNYEELRERFHSDDVNRIDEAIDWVLNANDPEVYSTCLKGWKTRVNGEKIQLAFDPALLEEAEAIIKKDGWRSEHGTYSVLRLLAQPMEGANYDASLDLSRLTSVGLKGVQCSVLPEALSQCTALHTLDLDGCDALERLDDLRLIHCAIRKDAEWVVKSIDKMTCSFDEIAACFEAELKALPAPPTSGDQPSISLNPTYALAVREWKENNRELPQLTRGFTLFQALNYREETNESTQTILDYFTENAENLSLVSVPDVSLDEVQLAPIVAHLMHGLNQNPDVPRSATIHLSGDWENWYLRFLSRLSETNPLWCTALIYDLPISAAISVFSGDVWDPRIMYDGSVVIRNHHRVIVPDYIGTVFMSDTERRLFLEQLDQIPQDWCLVVGSVEGELTLHTKASELSEEAIRNGNNSITILNDEETIAQLHPAIQSWIGFVYENTRSGMMVRVIPGGVSFYRTYRGSDDFDFALENLIWAPFTEASKLGEVSTGYKFEESPLSYSGIEWDEKSRIEDKYVYSILLERMEWDILDGVETGSLRMVHGLGISNLDVLYSEFAANMKKYAVSHFPVTQQIFSKNTEYPLGYENHGKKMMDFMAVHGYNTKFKFAANYDANQSSLDVFPSILSMVIGRLESKLFELNFKMESMGVATDEQQGKPLNPWGDLTVFYEQNTAMVMTLPYACHSVKKTEIEAHFGDRIVDLNVDIAEQANTTKQMFVRLNLQVDKSGTSIDEADVDFVRGLLLDYVETACEGDWSSFADEFWDFFAIYTQLPRGLLFDMQELGKAFTSINDFDWFAEDTSSLLAAYLGISLPFAGTSQGFDSGDLDSGNM